MGSDVTATRMRALLIPDPRVTVDGIWAAQSTYTQAGLRPDTPTKTSGADSHLSMNATGTVATAQEGKDLRIKCQRAGMPSNELSRGAFVWQNDGDAHWRGWDAPNVITDWEAIAWVDGVSPVNSDFHAITLATDRVLVAQAYLSGGSYSLYVRRRAPSDGAWATSVVASFGASNNPNPCLLLLPSGRVMLWAWFRDTDGSIANVRGYFSDDDGATWSVASERALAADINIAAVTAGYEVGRLRAAYANGSICLVSEIKQNDTSPKYRDVFQQWVSTDLGASFSAIGNTWNGETTIGLPANDGGGKYHEIIPVGASFFMFYIDTDTDADGDGTPQLSYRKVGSAFEAFEDADSVDTGLDLDQVTKSAGTSNTVLSAGQLAAYADPSGRVYLLGRGGTDAMRIGVSFDRCETFTAFGSGIQSDTWYEQSVSAPSSTYPNEVTATHQGGRTIVVHNLVSAGTVDNSAVATYLGGWSSVTMPALFTSPAEQYQLAFENTYLPFDLPASVGWTKATGGSPTESIAAASLDLATTAGTSSIYYHRDITGDAYSIARGFALKVSLKVNAGSSTVNDFVAVRIRTADNTNDYDISLRFGTTGWLLVDNEAGATVGTATVSTTAGIEVLLGIAGDEVVTYYRVHSILGDRVWTAGPTTTSLTDGGAGTANNRIEFGRIATSATADAEFYSLQYTGGDGAWVGPTGQRLSDLTFPGDLFPRDYSASPSLVTGGISVAAIDGPAFVGDEFSIVSRYEYGIGRAVVGSDEPPSPRIRWRSANETEHTIAFGLTATPGADEVYPFCDAIGVALLGINFHTATLQGYDVGTTAWVDLVVMDSATDMSSLSWTRKGDTVAPTSGSSHSVEPFFSADELVGGTFALDGDKRKIVGNSPGSWSGSHASKRLATVQVELSGSEGASGTSGAIWAPQLAGTVPLLGNTYSAYRIKIGASQGTVDGHYEIGAIVVGPLFVFADTYAWGRSQETHANTELTQTRDWTTLSRVVGPARRTLEFGWTDPVDQYAFGAASPDPNYVKTTTTAGSLPVASKGATIRQMEGYLRQLDGPHTPVVYFPRIVKSTTQADDDRVYTRRGQFLFGRIVSSVRRDAVLGDENQDELVRLVKTTIQEEV